MYGLFSSNGHTADQGVLRDPADTYLRNSLHRNLTTVVNFHRKNPMAVKSNHFLVRLLQSIPVPQSLSTDRYYNNVDAMALNLSMAMRMTSPISKGSLFNGIFFGKGNVEILIAHSESFNPFDADADWENIEAIKVLRHPRSDLGLNIPDGTNTGMENGLVVIAINIPLLAIQYRAFRHNEEYYNITNESVNNQRSVMHFVYMYVLPNMLKSILDYSLFNSIKNLEYGVPIGTSTKKHSFFLPNYDDKVIRQQNNVLNYLQNVDRSFAGVLRSIMAVGSNTAYEAMMMPDIPETRPVIPALFLARLDVLRFLFKIAKDGAGVKNKTLVNQILREIDIFDYKSMLKPVLTNALYTEVMNNIDELESNV